MQLTSLEIFGFKSFADRTKFVFDEGITGIVGPNGCGKSNIVDAIRWVLGEQKTRNLRSDKMENIIFNGTKSRRKANFAEVSLTFENTKNILPTEYGTVSITRKLYRSGESEYQLNGVTCRLKDIQNLFMDTGVSSDSYAIIELRMVDEILTNKDNERRKFIEEAAGISKYKVRKRQTLKRLKDTDDDLERVEDLLYEVEKNMKSLEKQARRTQKYFELKESYKQVSSQYAWLSMQGLAEREKQLSILEVNLGDQYVQSQSQLAQHEARLQELKKVLLDQEKALSEAQRDLNAHLRHIQNVETEKSVKNERLKYLQQREIAIQDQMESERRQIERNESVLKQLREDQMRLEKELATQQEEESALKAELDQLRTKNEAEQKRLEELLTQERETEQTLQDLTREKEVKKVQVQSLESELNRAIEDRDAREDDLDSFTGKADKLKTEVEKLQAEVSGLQEKQEAHEEKLSATESEVTALKDTVYKTNRRLDARQNEYNLTKSLVENLEGFPASVKFLKKNASWIKKAPLLSDIFSVPEDYKVSLESYLEPYLSYYVVASREDAIRSVHMLNEASKGRANFFVLDELENYKAINPLIFTQASPAMDVVEFAPEHRRLAAYLLDRVYFVDKEGDIPDDIPEEVVFLTKTGNLSRRRFQLGGGSLGLFEGKRLGRAKNLEKLEKEIAKLQKQLTSDHVKLDKANDQLDDLRKVNFRKQLEPIQKELTEKERDYSVLVSREKEHREFIARVGQRAESLQEQLESLKAELVEIDPRQKQYLESLQQLTSQVAEQRVVSQASAERQKEASERYNQAHIRLIHLQNQFENVGNGIRNKEEETERYQGNRRRLEQDLETVRDDTEGLISSNLQDDSVIVELYEEKKEKDEATGLIEEKMGQTRNSISQVEESIRKERNRMDNIRQQQQELSGKGTDLKLELTSLRERMSVEFNLDLKNLNPEEIFEKPIDSYDPERLEEDLNRLRGKVHSFGEINPMAVEAFEEMKTRFDFIDGQRNDLIEAKNSLLETIAEIDQTAKEKFLETFALVRDHFTNVFRSLFSEDDKCDLLLLDEENPLESEVSIIARPKGKRPLTIKQLSGGEKTLTAVALLFAIYLIKPAPFCVFDEVDAPLDDANIDKFNNIIRDFSQQSQFIIVTHNKRTMASTNVMYGVTMENRGISRILPVDLAQLNLN